MKTAIENRAHHPMLKLIISDDSETDDVDRIEGMKWVRPSRRLIRRKPVMDEKGIVWHLPSHSGEAFTLH